MARAETLPNALTPSDFTVDVAAGDGGIGDDASSIDPNVTTMPFEKCFESNAANVDITLIPPCFAAFTVLCGTLMPSFMGIPWPRVLGLRE
jgi:hypothetical protein